MLTLMMCAFENIITCRVLHRVIKFNESFYLVFLWKILLYNENRIQLLLPQISRFLVTWIPQVPVPSHEAYALLSYVGLIIEASFHLDYHVVIV